MMWDSGYGYGGLGAWIGFGLMMLFGLLVLAGLIALTIWLVRGSMHGGTGGRSATSDACDIAKVRYARGEISKEQFDEICRTVSG